MPIQIGDFTVSFIAHTAFLFRTSGGTMLLTEPFYMKGFTWDGQYETYLSPPDVPAEAIRPCDAVFVSHIHPDHCDPEALLKIHRNTGARIIGPEDVLELLQSVGIPKADLIRTEDGVGLSVGDIRVTPMCGYDRSFDDKKRPNKFSIIMESGGTPRTNEWVRGTRLFFSGDCHEVPPRLKGQKVDALFWWPHPDEAKVRQFRDEVRFNKLVLMHGDRFQPGRFLCNLDYAKEKARLAPLLPGVEILIPERIKRLEWI